MTNNNSLTFNGRIRSVRFAIRGIRTMVASQHNAWIHAAATVVVVTMGLLVGLSWAEWCWIVLAVVSELSPDRREGQGRGGWRSADRGKWRRGHWGAGLLAEAGWLASLNRLRHNALSGGRFRD